MSVISMKQLLEAGVHFGHQTRRWNPKMAKYIFTERNGIHIIDLQKTVKKVEAAYAIIREVAENDGAVLFVGTKKQAQEAVKEEAIRCGQFYVNNRWLGGMLTNYKTIKKRIQRLKDLEAMEETGLFDVLPKKEVIGLRHEMEKLEKNLGGIKEMNRIPAILFVIDPKKETNAVAEAKKLNIPVVGIVDTNCDPDEIDYVIPGNDDAIRAIKLISAVVANAVIEAKQGEQLSPEEEKQVEFNSENKVVVEAKVEEAKVEEPKVEEPKVEEAKVEEAKVEEPKAEEAKVEEAKVEETKVEEAKAEEVKEEIIKE